MAVISRDYYYSQLSNPGKELYRKVLSAMNNNETSFFVGELSDACLRDFDDIIEAVFFDNPQFVSYTEIGGTKYEDRHIILNRCSVDAREYNSKYQELLSTRLNGFQPNDSLWNKCKKAYDYLSTTLLYDWELYNENNNTDYHHSFSPYGLVMTRKGVCMGIAKLFKILCDECNIPCICVPAKLYKENGQYDEHMLNIVEVEDGRPAYIDVTTGLADNFFPYPKYDCFLESTEVAKKSYDVNTKIYCNASDLSFLYKNNLIFADRFDLRAHLEGYSFYSTQGVIRFRYSGDRITKKEMSDLLYDCVGEHITREFDMAGHFFKSDFGCCHIGPTKED